MGKVLEATASNSQQNPPTTRFSFETKALLVLSMVFVIGLAGAWIFALKLQRTVATNSAFTAPDRSAIVELERLRWKAEAYVDNGRAFFLLGAASLFEKQKQGRDDLLKALDAFESQYPLPAIPALAKTIRDDVQKTQDLFEQGMDFREKKTESKIVGQFFQAKAMPVLAEMHKTIDEMVKIHQDEIDRINAEARDSVSSAEASIPQGMLWLTVTLGVIFLCLSILILTLVRRRKFQLAQQERLYREAQKAVQDRDEALNAIAHDLKDSLELISSTAGQMPAMPSMAGDSSEAGELIVSTVTTIQGLIQDIRDGKASEMDGITLRLDQLAVDQVLDQARLQMQPLAKKHDVHLQVDQASQHVLAFFDSDRVLRVLSNLIRNALKHSRKGDKVVVKARSDQKFVYISVADNGEGIPRARLEGIFDQFWQASKTADQGAGVGLAIVKAIITAHGGTVEIQSNLGHGTTVTFSLPRHRPAGVPLKRTAPVVRVSQAPSDWI